MTRSLGALALLLALGQAPAWAADLAVNSLDDPGAPGDGGCTLREAIDNANLDGDMSGGDCAAGSGADTITFTVSGTIVLNSTLPTVTDTDALTIDGPGAAQLMISGNNAVQVLLVQQLAGALTVQDLTIANGNSPGSCGGIGGFPSTLNVINSTFSGNSAENSGAIDNGGKVGLWSIVAPNAFFDDFGDGTVTQP